MSFPCLRISIAGISLRHIEITVRRLHDRRVVYVGKLPLSALVPSSYADIVVAIYRITLGIVLVLIGDMLPHERLRGIIGDTVDRPDGIPLGRVVRKLKAKRVVGYDVSAVSQPDTVDVFHVIHIGLVRRTSPIYIYLLRNLRDLRHRVCRHRHKND